jgi:Zn-dependent metalloprotease
MNLGTRVVPLVVLSIALSPQAQAQGRGQSKREPIDPAGIARLVADEGAQVSVSEATGAARFVKIAPGKKLGLQSQAARSALSGDARKDRAAEFFATHGSVFGITNMAAELKEVRAGKDRQGATHITYQQIYHGMPVFAGELRSHFDAADELVAVNGTFVPELLVDPNPRRTAEEASRTAVAKVETDLGKSGKLSAVGTTLLVFREGLAKGVPGPNHLAWQVEVGDGAGVREFVYVDAHTGKFVDQITGVYDGLNRRAYDGAFSTLVPPPNYPATPFWVENQTFPTLNVEADNMITSSKETYDFYNNAFGRDSFDGLGATMDAIFNRGNACPNASWNGTFISFCNGLTTDDVTGHEWTHAYTQYTDGLIYQWQPGALNESYSDIFGETIDRINGRGTDTPDNPRTANTCSAITGGTPPPTLTITGGSAAGSYFARASVNEPARPFTVGPTDLALAVPASACSAVTGVAGKIAIVDWTLTSTGANECGSGARAGNALAAGATGIIFVAPASGILNLGSLATIASVEVTNADGAKIKAGLPASATMTLGVGTDNSVRWLVGEDDNAVGLSGALRDMWNPRCFGNPGKVSDTFEYVCGPGTAANDNGGVHSNSGVPNHGYALLVDGGTYNGQTITGIGLTKAAHIYFRAMSVYQGPASDFADHADALDQSCSDLIGTDLADLVTGAPSGQAISTSDCAQVAKVALAVELRTPPTQCNFQPLLAKTPPNRCEAGTVQANIFADTFENPPVGWSVAHVASTPDFTPRDWQVVAGLPDNRPGRAFFGPDPNNGTCLPGGDESGVLQLLSPVITLPAGAANPRLTFDHWVATETGWDGGNLKVSVNGGPWQVVAAADYTYNPYNTTLFTVAQGNTNPLSGQPGFSGADGGAVAGSWGRSHVNLANYAAPGNTVQLRFDLGNDGCGGVVGWYVDDPTVYACVPAGKPTISIADAAVTEGNSGFTEANFKVTLSHASATPVSVWYITELGTALPLLDYLPELQQITFAPLQLEANITIKVRGEKLVEKDETFFVKLLLPHNGVILDRKATGTILNDDSPRH